MPSSHGRAVADDYEDDYESNSQSYGYTDILDNYTVECSPALQLKGKWRRDQYKLSATATLRQKYDDPALVLSIKPLAENSWWRKIEVTPGNRGLSLYTGRLHLGIFDVQLEAHSNVQSRYGLRWRLFPKWSSGKSGSKITYKDKRDIPSVAGMELRTYVQVDMGWPEWSGGFGGAATSRQRTVDFQAGYCHIDVPRVAFVWDQHKADVQGNGRKPGSKLAIRDIDSDDEGPMI